MAPTEILAAQHMDTISQMLSPTGIKIDLLTGSTNAKQKHEIKSRLINGETDLVIGTHALIQNDVEFRNLGVVITDEQHRFGVNQRANLAMKGNEVHTLVMSATPIPRTLALMIYGDLDISVLDELPAGRRKIRTDVVDTRYHKRIYEFVKKQLPAANRHISSARLLRRVKQTCCLQHSMQKSLHKMNLKAITSDCFTEK